MGLMKAYIYIYAGAPYITPRPEGREVEVGPVFVAPRAMVPPCQSHSAGMGTNQFEHLVYHTRRKMSSPDTC